MKRELIIFILFIVLAAAPGYAEIYKWVDKNGVVHYTDSPGNIPEQYQETYENLEEKPIDKTLGIDAEPRAPAAEDLIKTDKKENQHWIDMGRRLRTGHTTRSSRYQELSEIYKKWETRYEGST